MSARAAVVERNPRPWPLWLVAAPWPPVAVAWLADVAGHGLPAALNAAIVVVALLTTLTGIAVLAVRLARGQVEGGRAAGRALLALLALSLAVRFVGLDFELLDHPRNDEGVYYQRSLDVNDGDLVPKELNYGHLPYYLGAVTLWGHQLLPAVTAKVAGALYGLEREAEFGRILLRGLGALAGALTTLPVFWIAYRIGGLAAAGLGGLLIIFASLYNQVAHTWLSDVPSAFFAALCVMCVARLVDEERLRDYLLAGVAAGLAAGCKYPGGVVAVAIAGMWLYWRLRTRSWSWSLLWAALASIAALCTVMPAIWLSWDSLFRGEGLDIMFGYRQYARGGWAGVVKPSNTLWYGSKLVVSFGWVALAGGITGLVWLRGEERRRWAVLALFPALYLALIVMMRMVVERNLLPFLPAAAALLGAGLAGWLRWTGRLPAGVRRPVAVGVAVLALAAPAARTIAWDISQTRPGTRQVAKAWLAAHVPEGAGIISEDYTPRLSSQRFQLLTRRFAARVPLAQMRDGTWDFLVLSRNAHNRFLDPELRLRPEHEAKAKQYEEMFDFELAVELHPGPLRAGSHIAIYRLAPQDVPVRTAHRFEASEATWVSDPKLRRPDGRLHYWRKWQYGLFKGYFEAGTYALSWTTTPPSAEGWVVVVSRDNVEIGTFDREGAAQVVLPRRDKYFFKVFLAPPATLESLAVAPASSPPEETAPAAAAQSR